MSKQILFPLSEAPAKKFWKPWKWIGLAIYAAVLLLNRWLPIPVIAAGHLYGIVVVANLFFYIVRYLKDRFFWRVRNRLIGSFIFVGFIPLLVLLGIIFLSTQLLIRQLAVHYLNASLQENEQLISRINAELAGRIGTADIAKTFPAKAQHLFSNYSAQFSNLAGCLLHRRPDGKLETIAKYDPQLMLRDISPHPGDKWRGPNPTFDGFLRDGENGFLASFKPVPGSEKLYVVTAAPMDSHFEERLRREKSLYVAFLYSKDADIQYNGKEVQVLVADDKEHKSEGLRITGAGKADASNSEDAKNITDKIQEMKRTLSSDRTINSASLVQWFMPLPCRYYGTGEADQGGFTYFYVPRSVVFTTYLGWDDLQRKILLFLIYIMSGAFVITAFASLAIGFTISRHVTRSVHDLYQGILALQKGDLQHTIPVRRKDQLGLLANSFNQMSASISRLLEEVVEKKRLEQELEIAREVQATLFPKQLPHPPGLSIFGGCKPARIVSGDYYDFIVKDEAHLDIIVGDISGKGISAALLMANMQATIRNQLLSGKQDSPEAIGQNLIDIMGSLNTQIYRNSPPEKYATLFLSRYDPVARRLSYCNAGHPPPIVLNSQGMQMLESTGTVVGMFPDASYQIQSIDLPSGSLLAIFTDGITEAMNKDDEEFSQDQLLQVLQQSSTRSPEEIWEHVLSKAVEWQDGLPQSDDMTLIVAKVQ